MRGAAFIKARRAAGVHPRPLLDFAGNRDDLNAWAARPPHAEPSACQQRKNPRSIDSFPTRLPGAVDT
jgi:hypothetical protein